jgi:hypothetical protein
MSDMTVGEDIPLVVCPQRLDGIYAFETPDLAEEFRDAVMTHGGEAILNRVPVNGERTTRELIAAEANR